MSSAQWQSKLQKAAQRRRQAWDLYVVKGGHTMEAIAAQLGVHHATIGSDIRRMLRDEARATTKAGKAGFFVYWSTTDRSQYAVYQHRTNDVPLMVEDEFDTMHEAYEAKVEWEILSTNKRLFKRVLEVTGGPRHFRRQAVLTFLAKGKLK